MPCGLWHFPDQGSNLCPLQGKYRVFLFVWLVFFEVQSLNHWTTREVPKSFFYIAKQCCI